MSLDFPAVGQALWDLYDKGGPRPEFILPVLYNESQGFQTTIQNQLGAANYGLNQISLKWLTAHHIALADYLSWPASTQIRRVVTPFILGLINDPQFPTGPLNSGIQVYQANFIPASLSAKAAKATAALGVHYAPSLDDPIVTKANDPVHFYSGNTSLDVDKKGYITPRDLGIAVSRAADTTAVQSAIAQTYALRPGAVPEDPVHGPTLNNGPLFASTNFLLPIGWFPPRTDSGAVNWPAMVAVVGLVGVAAWGLNREGYLDGVKRVLAPRR